ncbi:MAG: AAA family ATPase [Bdellovibrionales bacterium]|nr:AAA family ATPase [Bdellovibrionales bacterium]
MNQERRKETAPNAAPVDTDAILECASTLERILNEMSRVVVGQEHMNRSLVIGLVTGGHILLEGLPGLAKTLTVRTLAEVLDTHFQRIQFTPDLLPTDIIGTLIYNEKTQEFTPKKGPIFANIILADEINRAPAKVQSALLEAMAEKQVTIGDTTFALPQPFLVMATQNPIEQEGTYNLPEAQLDRFMFKVKVDYPSRDEERVILELMSSGTPPKTQTKISTDDVLKARKLLDKIYVDERIKEYILRLVVATRKNHALGPEEASPEAVNEIRRNISVGGSPRATLFLSWAARAQALMEKRHFITPDDVKFVAREVLRHRLILTFEAEAKNTNTDDVIGRLLEAVAVP